MAPTRNLPANQNAFPPKHPSLPRLKGRIIPQLDPRPPTKRHPTPQADVRYRALGSDQVGGFDRGEVVLEDGVGPADFVLRACAGVGDFFRGVAEVVVCLALCWALGGGLEEEPVLPCQSVHFLSRFFRWRANRHLYPLPASFGIADLVLGVVRLDEILQDAAAFEEADLFAVGG